MNCVVAPSLVLFPLPPLQVLFIHDVVLRRL
jgi:hypothetical protein